MRTRIVLAIAGLLIGSGTLPAQNLIQNGSFETPQLATDTPAAATPVPGWTPTGSATLEVQRLLEGDARAQDGAQWVELDTDQNTMIHQDVATVSGQLYLIRFLAANRIGSPSSRIDVLWNGAMIGAADTTSTGFQRFTFEATAAGSVSRLGLRAGGASDSFGDLVDHVELLPIPATGSNLGYSYYLAQFADGGAWETTLSFVSDIRAEVAYVAYDSSGMTYDGLSGTFFLAPLENKAVVGAGGDQTQVGWIRVWSSEPITVSAIYRQRVEGRPDQEASVLSREPTAQVVVPFFEGVGFSTGVAVANPNARPLTLSVHANLPGGGRLMRVLMLDALEHSAFVLNAFMPGAAGSNGTLEIDAVFDDGLPAPFVLLGLRAQDSGAFATLPY